MVVPTLLVQMLLVQPARWSSSTGSPAAARACGPAVRRLITNPLTVAALVGLVLALTGWELPRIVMSPIELLAGCGDPAMLLSYGAALRLSPPAGRAGHNGEVLVATRPQDGGDAGGGLAGRHRPRPRRAACCSAS